VKDPADYIPQALAATGFAFLDLDIACALRPDLFPGGQASVPIGGLNPGRIRSDGGIRGGINEARRYVVWLEGREKPALVLARSDDMLAMRIQWITGSKVLSFAPEVRTSWTGAPADPSAAPAAERKAANLAKLRALAEQEPPTHHCQRRTEILQARDALTLAGQTWKAPETA